MKRRAKPASAVSASSVAEIANASAPPPRPELPVAASHYTRRSGGADRLGARACVTQGHRPRGLRRGRPWFVRSRSASVLTRQTKDRQQTYAGEDFRTPRDWERLPAASSASRLIRRLSGAPSASPLKSTSWSNPHNSARSAVEHGRVLKSFRHWRSPCKGRRRARRRWNPAPIAQCGVQMDFSAPAASSSSTRVAPKGKRRGRNLEGRTRETQSVPRYLFAPTGTTFVSRNCRPRCLLGSQQCPSRPPPPLGKKATAEASPKARNASAFRGDSGPCMSLPTAKLRVQNTLSELPPGAPLLAIPSPKPKRETRRTLWAPRSLLKRSDGSTCA